jgi:hypothetical protein
LKDRVLSSFPGFMSSWKSRNPPWSSRERKVTYKAIGIRLLLPIGTLTCCSSGSWSLVS